MPRQQRFLSGRAILAAATVSLVLGACSMDRLSDYVPKAPDLKNFEWSPYTNDSTTVPLLTRKTVTAADYVNADGSCVSASSESAGTEQVQTGVALQMTECAVVQALGVPEKIDVGANERGDRLVTMLYSRGERRGLYHFTAGQLTSIERIDEPAPPPKPQKPAPKPRRAAA